MMQKWYQFIFICLVGLASQQPLQAQEIGRLPNFEQWVGQLPNLQISEMTLFQHPTFLQGMKQLNHGNLWQSYLFNQVQQKENWLLVNGYSPNDKDRTFFSIFIDSPLQQVKGICFTDIIYYEGNPHEGNPSGSLTSVQYYVLGHYLPLFIDRPDCGGNNINQAMEQWQEIIDRAKELPDEY